MSCEDIPSLLDLQKVKKHADDFGRLMGTGEGDSTNEVTGQVRPTYNKVMKNLGFKQGSGDFTTGFTVVPGQRDVAWYDPISKNWYSYLGVIPAPSGQTVAPGTNPVGDIDWAPRTDQLLRNQVQLTVNNIAALRVLIPDGNLVAVEYHSVIGHGAGVYKFVPLSSAVDNDGAIIASSVGSGVWFLVSPLTFENFGVTEEAIDQSAKINACLTYADENDIYIIEFASVKKCHISAPIVFKPVLAAKFSTFYATELALNIKTNGVVFVPLVDDFIMFKVHREHVNIDKLCAFGANRIKVSLLRLGLHDEPDYGPPGTYRYSASFFKCQTILATGVEVGIQFCPSKTGYGAYYHQIGDMSFRDVTHGLLFDVSPTGDNQTTRTTINSYNHNGGAVAVLGLNVETLNIPSFNAENLHETSTITPAASGFGIFIPQVAVGMSLGNHSIWICGSTEDVPNPYFCDALRSEIDVYPVNYTIDSPNALAGRHASGYGGRSAMVGCTNLNEWVFSYTAARMAVVAIVGGSAGSPSLPAGGGNGYGNIQWLPCSNQMAVEGVQVYSQFFPEVGIWVRKVTAGSPNVLGQWVRMDSSNGVLRKDRPVDTSANLMTNGNYETTYSATYSAANGAANFSPSGGEFYGAITWVPTIAGQGVQIAYGTFPVITRKRAYNGSSWTAWAAL